MYDYSYDSLSGDYLATQGEIISQQVEQLQGQGVSITASGTTDGQVAIFVAALQAFVAGSIASGNGIAISYVSSPAPGLAIAVNDPAALRTAISVDAIATRKSNLGASAAPTVNDDSGDGYGIGSIWADTTADDAYIALDVTVGAAVWKKITP